MSHDRSLNYLYALRVSRAVTRLTVYRPSRVRFATPSHYFFHLMFFGTQIISYTKFSGTQFSLEVMSERSLMSFSLSVLTMTHCQWISASEQLQSSDFSYKKLFVTAVRRDIRLFDWESRKIRNLKIFIILKIFIKI